MHCAPLSGGRLARPGGGNGNGGARPQTTERPSAQCSQALSRGAVCRRCAMRVSQETAGETRPGVGGPPLGRRGLRRLLREAAVDERWRSPELGGKLTEYRRRGPLTADAAQAPATARRCYEGGGMSPTSCRSVAAADAKERQRLCSYSTVSVRARTPGARLRCTSDGRRRLTGLSKAPEASGSAAGSTSLSEQEFDDDRVGVREGESPGIVRASSRARLRMLRPLAGSGEAATAATSRAASHGRTLGSGSWKRWSIEWCRR